MESPTADDEPSGSTNPPEDDASGEWDLLAMYGVLFSPLLGILRPVWAFSGIPIPTSLFGSVQPLGFGFQGSSSLLRTLYHGLASVASAGFGGIRLDLSQDASIVQQVHPGPTTSLHCQ